MKKPIALLFCLCVSLAVFCPGIVAANVAVNDAGCLVCHDSSFGTGSLHSTHQGKECTICHVATTGGDTPASSKCVVCHPSGNPGKCPLVIVHEDGGAVCFSCHQNCEQVTTTTTTVPGGPCAAEEIYGENSAQVQILRALRDGVLSKSPEGREIIKLYYQWSPIITMAVKNDPAFKAEMKAMIDGILGLAAE